jgi:hypothetical protein
MLRLDVRSVTALMSGKMDLKIALPTSKAKRAKRSTHFALIIAGNVISCLIICLQDDKSCYFSLKIWPATRMSEHWVTEPQSSALRSTQLIPRLVTHGSSQ